MGRFRRRRPAVVMGGGQSAPSSRAGLPGPAYMAVSVDMRLSAAVSSGAHSLMFVMRGLSPPGLLNPLPILARRAARDGSALCWAWRGSPALLCRASLGSPGPAPSPGGGCKPPAPGASGASFATLAAPALSAEATAPMPIPGCSPMPVPESPASPPAVGAQSPAGMSLGPDSPSIKDSAPASPLAAWSSAPPPAAPPDLPLFPWTSYSLS